MAPVPKPARTNESAVEPSRTLRILVAYDGFESGLRALQLYQRMSRNFDHEFFFDVDFWRFEILIRPSFGEEAALQAAQADIVIIAVDGTCSLPFEVQIWIEKWVRKKTGQQSAFVYLPANPCQGTQGSTYLRAYLRGVAVRGNMDFISPLLQKNGSRRRPEWESSPRPTGEASSITEIVYRRLNHPQSGGNK
ncbi:MAG: hypothetical protein HY735_36495 [Verrucomicrobia bacterium]|nr:hypothetical protein [Verrucomicrobiota bacterium]